MILKGILVVVSLALFCTAASAKSDRDGRNYENSDDRYEYKEEKSYKRMHKDKKEKRMNRGIQKKLDRGGSLPPGWQKKLRIGRTLDREVYRHSRVVEPLNIRGEITIEVDERLIRLHKATMEIVDILK